MTLRELLAMAEHRQRDEWARTSSIMALIANTHRNGKRQRAFRPSDFDPFAHKSGVIEADVSVLKDLFIDGRVPENCGNS